MAYFLLMEALIIGAFAAQDLFLFYIFFEGGLIPMYLIIGIWGGAERIKASYKFFLYTLLGSVLMLIAMIYMAGTADTTSIPALMAYNFPPRRRPGCSLPSSPASRSSCRCGRSTPGLPDAHVQAPTAGSVILAGVLLKLGGYGFIRFSLPMFPQGSAEFVPLMFVLSGIAVVYTSLVALVQTDMKKLIAYSSVAHMGFVTFGLFAMNRQGIEGAMIVMLSHGLVSGALFLVVGVVYDRLHTREIDRYGGLAEQHAGLCLAVHDLHHGQRRPSRHQRFRRRVPELGRDLRASTWGAIAATTGIILGAAYMLWLYWRICFGTARDAGRGGDARSVGARMVAARPDRGRLCSGWASIPRRSCARSAMTSGGCSCGSQRLRPRAIRR